MHMCFMNQGRKRGTQAKVASNENMNFFFDSQYLVYIVVTHVHLLVGWFVSRIT